MPGEWQGPDPAINHDPGGLHLLLWLTHDTVRIHKTYKASRRQAYSVNVPLGVHTALCRQSVVKHPISPVPIRPYLLRRSPFRQDMSHLRTPQHVLEPLRECHPHSSKTVLQPISPGLSMSGLGGLLCVSNS